MLDALEETRVLMGQIDALRRNMTGQLTGRFEGGRVRSYSVGDCNQLLRDTERIECLISCYERIVDEENFNLPLSAVISIEADLRKRWPLKVCRVAKICRIA